MMQYITRILSILIENRMYVYAVSLIVSVMISYAFEIFLTKYKKSKDESLPLARMQRIVYPKIGALVYLYNPTTDRYGYVEVIKAKVVSVLHKGQYFVVSELNTDEGYMYTLKHSQLVYTPDNFLFILDETSIKPRIGDMIRVQTPSDFIQSDEVDVESGYYTLSRVVNPKKVILNTPDNEISVPLSSIQYSNRTGFTV